MVDVGAKPVVLREAVAEGFLRLRAGSVERIRQGDVEKGDVFAVARVAGVLAAKRTSELVPLCHPLSLTDVDVRLAVVDKARVRGEATVRAVERTGVEMEALVAVSVALLTVWDMVKPYEKDAAGQYPVTRIEGVRVLRKVKGDGE
ncbi:MAG: cyclic pyranopterin monophosphate synthase MoaC [Candidatus Bathyarchaeota archaeon]|nr:cyclic pyranopterin monophosphate synthase MoaC [Candidatus Bathyarchaeota archaeon]MDH5779885.1 cyclic pyranopterin monophosphate synthase MoaC [Candidatus Bathyarchaeota archaeon]